MTHIRSGLPRPPGTGGAPPLICVWVIGARGHHFISRSAALTCRHTNKRWRFAKCLCQLGTTENHKPPAPDNPKHALSSLSGSGYIFPSSTSAKRQVSLLCCHLQRRRRGQIPQANGLIVRAARDSQAIARPSHRAGSGLVLPKIS